MKTHLKHLCFILVSLVASFAFTACNDSNSAPTGPSSSSSFSGTSISFNPTVNFTTGNALTYLNAEVGSSFPAAAIATAGTYTYVPNADFTTGTLTLTVSGITDPIVLDISNFVHSGTNITGFTIRSGGQSYPAIVTGTLPAYQPPASGGGEGGGAETRATDIPASAQGTYSLTFIPSPAVSLSPVADVPMAGSTASVVIAARTLTIGSKTLSNPVFRGSETAYWIFKDGALEYGLGTTPGGALSEITLTSAGSAGSFHGQYRNIVQVPVTDGKPTSGSVTAKVESRTLQAGFPASDALAVGDSINVIISTDSVTVDGETYAFLDISDPNGANDTIQYFRYQKDANNILSVGVDHAGDRFYVSAVNLFRLRSVAAPGTGIANANFYMKPGNPGIIP